MAIELTTSKYGENGRTFINTGNRAHDVDIAAHMLEADACGSTEAPFKQIWRIDTTRSTAAIVQFAFQTPPNQDIVVFYDGIRATMRIS